MQLCFSCLKFDNGNEDDSLSCILLTYITNFLSQKETQQTVFFYPTGDDGEDNVLLSYNEKWLVGGKFW